MGLRGPKSAHEKAAAAVRAVQVERIACPKHLPREAKLLWERIVATKHPLHFIPSDSPLLEAYCVQYAIHRQAQAAAARAIKAGGMPEPELLRTIRQCATALATLATKLRLAPNSRLPHDGHTKQLPDVRVVASETPAGKRAGLMFGG